MTHFRGDNQPAWNAILHSQSLFAPVYTQERCPVGPVQPSWHTGSRENGAELWTNDGNSLLLIWCPSNVRGPGQWEAEEDMNVKESKDFNKVGSRAHKCMKQPCCSWPCSKGHLREYDAGRNIRIQLEKQLLSVVPMKTKTSET